MIRYIAFVLVAGGLAASLISRGHAIDHLTSAGKPKIVIDKDDLS